MVKIFISHSRHDKDILDCFDRLFAGTNVKAIRVEFEEINNTPAEDIKRWIEESSSIFVLLGSNIINRNQTKSWISWETGLATSMKKPIWVFEQFDNPIDFPVPHVDHYILYNLGDKQHHNYIKSLIEEHEKNPELAAAVLGALIGGSIGSGPGALIGGLLGLLSKQNYKLPLTMCPYSDCRSAFYLHSKTNQFNCPICRRRIQMNFNGS